MNSTITLDFAKARTTGLWILGLGLTAVLVGACVSPRAALRELTYPPDFSYLPPEELNSAMWILAAEVSRLDQLLRDAPVMSGAAAARNQIAIQETLRRLSAAVEKIDEPGRVTQHPALNRNLRRFKERVDRAQRGAQRTPPNYYQASVVSGSCYLCHGSADERTAL
jgi:hypothetical protein